MIKFQKKKVVEEKESVKKIGFEIQALEQQFQWKQEELNELKILHLKTKQNLEDKVKKLENEITKITFWSQERAGELLNSEKII